MHSYGLTNQPMTVSTDVDVEASSSGLTSDPMAPSVLKEPTSSPTTKTDVITKASHRGKKKGHLKREKRKRRGGIDIKAS